MMIRDNRKLFSTLKYLKNILRNAKANYANLYIEAFILMSMEKSILMDLDNDLIGNNELGRYLLKSKSNS